MATKLIQKTAIDFRKWATKILKSYITDGYAVDKTKITQNYDIFIEILDEIKFLINNKNKQKSDLKPSFAIDLIRGFAETWLSLDAYDKNNLKIKNVTKKQITLSAKDLKDGIEKLRSELIKKNEAKRRSANQKNKKLKSHRGYGDLLAVKRFN